MDGGEDALKWMEERGLQSRDGKIYKRTNNGHVILNFGPIHVYFLAFFIGKILIAGMLLFIAVTLTPIYFI